MKKTILCVTCAAAFLSFTALSFAGFMGDVESIAREKCSACHGFGKVTAKVNSYSAEKWQKVVANMVKKGARLNEEEQQAVASYLANLGSK